MEISEIQGLSSAEVEAKHKKFGFNELPSRDKKSFFKILLSLVTEPMIALLLVTVTVYFVLGSMREAILLTLSVFGIIVIELYQESKTEKSLEALRNLSSPIANVIRDGRHTTVPGRDLVVGDIILLSEGSRVPADVKLVSAANLHIDESLLTGESVPVEKHTRHVGDYRTNSAFSGTLVVKGHGVAEVTAIGQTTEIGGIGQSLKTIETEKTLLQKEIMRVVKIVAVFAIGLSTLLTLLYWWTRGDFVHGLLAGLTLSISILPEEFPIVLTIFLTLGAWRLARKNILVRKAQTIETLGSATVLCVDKTGTLTQNKMEIQAITDEHGKPLKNWDDVVRFGVLASQKKPFDPMEDAFLNAGKNIKGGLKSVYKDWQIIKEYPIEEGALSVAHAWGKGSEPRVIALKGAPEAVFALCKLTSNEIKAVEKSVKEMASRGLRVLAVGKAEGVRELPDSRKDIKFTLVGLVGLADPIREEVPNAVLLCRLAGIRVIMLTGDYPDTAYHIAEQVGLSSGKMITGAEFAALTEVEQSKMIQNISVFSRVTPAHKLAIVRALKDGGEVVAMTGDGVNDAPALKAAHIGIAMGKKGTDVAREAATIILLNDDFQSIVQGVRLGRRIFDNLQKATSYLVTVHIPIAVLSLVPVLFGWELLLVPVHIVFLEFIIDPSCTIIFENEKEAVGIMDRPPRKLGSSLFSKNMLLNSVLQGVLVAIATVLSYKITTDLGWAHDKARGFTFLTLIAANIFVIVALSGRRAFADIVRRENAAMVTVLGSTAFALALVFYVPFLRELFKFQVLGVGEVLISLLVAGFAVFASVIFRKLLNLARF